MELVVGFGVAVLVLLDLALADDRLARHQREHHAALAVVAETRDLGGDAAGEENLVHVSNPFVVFGGPFPPG
ncbi:hypothetical protein [Novosphingobium olei]|uniref:hypothetical protein n=1 Tax=Novosphingobium olei TaxID=2728851 RepID=UPI001F110F66|nr:hypothetical protein [Novosphingobium olei]